MPVTATLVRATDYRLFYAIDYNNQPAGNPLIIASATLQADAAGKPHLLKVFQTAVANNTEAIFLLLGGVGCVSRLTPGESVAWSLDAQRGELSGLAELLIESGLGGNNNGILELQVTSAPMFRA
jgi:hypothetical protein